MLCLSCKHCVSIDVKGYVQCNILGETTIKVFCRYYAPRRKGEKEESKEVI